MRGTLLAAAVALSTTAAPGCGAFGNYLANRARDFGECFQTS